MWCYVIYFFYQFTKFQPIESHMGKFELIGKSNVRPVVNTKHQFYQQRLFAKKKKNEMNMRDFFYSRSKDKVSTHFINVDGKHIHFHSNG